MARRTRRTGRLAGLAALVAAACLLAAGPAAAASADEHRERRPDLFDPASGYRIDRYRAPTPDDVPGAERVTAGEAKRLIDAGAVAIDVVGAGRSAFDATSGAWLISKERRSIPGAVWLPEVGRGVIDPAIARYLEDNLDRLTGGDRDRAIVLFCKADCWMSWNAVQRAAALGYRDVHWFAEGSDGWRERGWRLVPVDPVPLAGGPARN